MIRMQSRNELQKTAIFFKEEKNINILNLLFPHIWQENPRKTNPNYHPIRETGADIWGLDSYT